MNKLFQETNATHYDRYPDIFGYMSELINEESKSMNKPVMEILSYGCSFGEEVKVFEEKYFKGHNIIGVDINEECIKKCNELGLLSKFFLASKFIDLDYTFDVVFCMSVLCKMVHSKLESPIDFNDFNYACKALDRRVNQGGYFVDYNSNYYFLDSNVGYKYEPVKTDSILKSNEHTIKYKPDGKTVMIENGICIFKKIKN